MNTLWLIVVLWCHTDGTGCVGGELTARFDTQQQCEKAATDRQESPFGLHLTDRPLRRYACVPASDVPTPAEGK